MEFTLYRFENKNENAREFKAERQVEKVGGNKKNKGKENMHKNFVHFKIRQKPFEPLGNCYLVHLKKSHKQH